MKQGDHLFIWYNSKYVYLIVHFLHTSLRDSGLKNKKAKKQFQNETLVYDYYTYRLNNTQRFFIVFHYETHFSGVFRRGKNACFLYYNHRKRHIAEEETMDRLMIIADDVTGGLDTGVCFSKAGIKTRVNLPGSDPKALDGSAGVEVFVIETRHNTPEKAYAKVFELVQNAAGQGFTHFYKKTDSALRGNPGAELAAMRDALGCETVHFLPSYPEMNRLTLNGIHYIDGTPVADSIFGRDPFNPVRESDVSLLLKSQDPEGRIDVYDSSTQEELTHKGRELLDKGETVFAGCAGFAEVLAELLDPEKDETGIRLDEKRICVLCGSVNPVSLRQCDEAVKNGIPRIHLIREGEMSERSDEITDLLKENSCVIMDTGGEVEPGEGIEERMAQVAGTVAETGGRILRNMPDTLLFFIGGDTLLSFLKKEGIRELIPHATDFSGTVLTQIKIGGKETAILSKSGGFGEPDLIPQIQSRIESGLKL